MQTHGDRDHAARLRALGLRTEEPEEAWQRLCEAAEAMTAARENVLTAGEPGEEPLREYDRVGVHVRHLPQREVDAELDVQRVSIGGVPDGSADYCVFRGDVRQVKFLLRRALAALREYPE